ncbi:MAG: HAD family hydrolase [Actinomycetes bacterium]
MNIQAVIFDWGGTLTPWHDVDLQARWLAYAHIYAPERADELARALHVGEQSRWAHQFDTQGETGTGALEAMFEVNGIDTSSSLHFEALEAYLRAWDPDTYTDVDAVALLEALRGMGIKTAVLSNTMWPRRHHESVLERDGILHLFDYLLFTSETTSAKPHRSVFTDVTYNLGVDPQHCAFVGDRLFDDIHGAQEIGMKGIWIPHSIIPAAQSTDLGIIPAATVQRLGDVLDVVNNWNAVPDGNASTL